MEGVLYSFIQPGLLHDVDFRAVPTAETGSATGFYQVLRNIGLSVGSALGAAVLLAYTPHGATYPDLGGFRVALLLSTALAVLTAVLAFVLPGRPPPADHRPLHVALDPVEARMEEEALLEAGGALLVDERDLDAGDRRP